MEKKYLLAIIISVILPSGSLSAQNIQHRESDPSSHSIQTENKYLPPRLRLIESLQKEYRDKLLKEKQDNDNSVSATPDSTETSLINNSIGDSHSENTNSSAVHTIKGNNSQLERSAYPNAVVEEWSAYYASGFDAQEDKATSIAYDINGYVIVTGFSESISGKYDFVTVKYDTAGILQWVVRYDGTGGDDYAAKVGVDSVGNIYVAGNSQGIDSYFYYTIVKYNQSGVEQWVTKYNNPSYVSDLAIDDSGNVYITGSSSGDYLTIKYNSSGAEQWSKLYNGPGNGDDEPAAIVIDKLGNVYVTGKSTGWGTSYDYATIIYKNDGSEIEGRYDGSANGSDEPIDIALDDSGNVYVTGSSEGVGSGYDYVTIKYNSSGMVWVARYDTNSSPNTVVGLALDDSGNVYVLGSFEVYSITIKYDKFGNLKWRNYENWGTLMPTSVAISDSGYIYITGINGVGEIYSGIYRFRTIKYDVFGNKMWDNYSGYTIDYTMDAISPPIIIIDSIDNAYITGSLETIARVGYKGSYSINFDYTTIKIDNLGNTIWNVAYNYAISNDSVIGLVIGKDGDSYITGASKYIVTDGYEIWNYLTNRYDSNGGGTWSERYSTLDGYGGCVEVIDCPSSLIIDNNSNIYISGRTNQTSLEFGCSYDYMTIGYNNTGEELWRDKYVGFTWVTDDKATCITTDTAGNVYVSGGSYTNWPGFGIDGYHTVKYDRNGLKQWVAVYALPESTNIYPKDIVVDEFGNVYVVGSEATIKYNNGGNELWVAKGGLDIAIDKFSNVYITGDSGTIKFNAEGIEQWSVIRGQFINLDDLGNVYVSETDSTSGNGNYLVTKYDNDGAQQWIKTYDGSANGEDKVVDMKMDRVGNVYLAGTSEGLGTMKDITAVKYNPEGVEQWVLRKNGKENEDDIAAGLAVDSLGYVYITGTSYGASGDTSNYLTVRYKQNNSISGIVFNDLNGNGIKDTFEPGIAGWTINLGGSTTASTLTDTSGRYEFLNLEIGTYTISQTLQGNWIQTKPALPDSYTVTVDINGTYIDDKYFGNYKYGSISGKIFEDANHNGIYDTGELGLSGWTVHLSGAKEGTTLTDENGLYGFDSLLSGIYNVSEIIEPCWTQSSTPTFYIDTVLSGDIKYPRHFGNYLIGGISGVKWYDVDADGIKDEGEPLLENWKIRLSVYDWILDSTLTTSSGYYFANLDRGAYVVTEELPDHWIQTYPPLGYHVVALGIDDTVSVGNINFGNRYIFNTSCQKGWNMVSVPVKVTDGTIDSLFPGAATSAFAYEGLYVEYDSLVNRIGYWIKFDNPQSINFPGIPILSDTFNLEKGWNLIGSISMPIADSNLSTLPSGVGLSRFFTYTGNYSEVRTITPGQGYWIKAEDSCKLLLSAQPPVTARVKFMSVSDLPPLPLGEEIFTKEQIPTEFSLSQNYPNPFNPLTTINYALPESRHVKLVILNMLGQVVGTLIDQEQNAGYKSITFDASDLPSGIYFYRLTAGDYTATKKLVIIK